MSSAISAATPTNGARHAPARTDPDPARPSPSRSRHLPPGRRAAARVRRRRERPLRGDHPPHQLRRPAHPGRRPRQPRLRRGLRAGRGPPVLGGGPGGARARRARQVLRTRRGRPPPALRPRHEGAAGARARRRGPRRPAAGAPRVAGGLRRRLQPVVGGDRPRQRPGLVPRAGVGVPDHRHRPRRLPPRGHPDRHQLRRRHGPGATAGAGRRRRARADGGRTVRRADRSSRARRQQRLGARPRPRRERARDVDRQPPLSVGRLQPLLGEAPDHPRRARRLRRRADRHPRRRDRLQPRGGLDPHRVGRRALHPLLARPGPRRPHPLSLRRPGARDDRGRRHRRGGGRGRAGPARDLVQPLRAGRRAARSGLDRRARLGDPRRQRAQRRGAPPVAGDEPRRLDGGAPGRPRRAPGHALGQHHLDQRRGRRLVHRQRVDPEPERRGDRALARAPRQRPAGAPALAGERHRRARRQRPALRVAGRPGRARSGAGALRPDAADRAHRLPVQRQRQLLVRQLARPARGRLLAPARRTGHAALAAHPPQRPPPLQRDAPTRPPARTAGSASRRCRERSSPTAA
jgi:hypothetical protein